MVLNPITCGICGAENPPDADYCENCGNPLTRSGQEGATGEGAEREDGGVFGVGEADPDVDTPGLEDGPPSPRNPHRGG